MSNTYHCDVCWTIDEGETVPLGSPTLTPSFRSLSEIQENPPSLSPLPAVAVLAIPFLVRQIR